MRVYVVSTSRGYRAKARDDDEYVIGYCCADGHTTWDEAYDHGEVLWPAITIEAYLAAKVYPQLCESDEQSERCRQSA